MEVISMSVIPKASAGKIIRNTGADRVSGDSIEMFSEVLEEYGTEIAAKAVSLAKHAGRKTVQVKDIKMALK